MIPFVHPCSGRSASQLAHRVSRILPAILLFLHTAAFSQTANLYTKPHADAAGGLSGHVNLELTHAIALEHDRVSCYKAELSDGGKGFRFTGLPIGKYDLVFITKSGAVYEGVALGEDGGKLSGVPLKHLEERIAKADTFFNKAKIERFGLTDNGEKILAFVERLAARQVLRQSGAALGSNLRRFEVIDLVKAGDDWQMMTNRHLYREEAPLDPNMDFFKHQYLPQIGNLRVVDSPKDLGTITLPPIG
jgi:hypothetical protein